MKHKFTLDDAREITLAIDALERMRDKVETDAQTLQIIDDMIFPLRELCEQIEVENGV